MKLLQRDLWQYGMVVYILCYTLSLILHGLIILFIISTDIDYSVKRFWYIDLIITTVLFLGIWKFLHYRFFTVTPSASFAYNYDDGPWLTWREDPKTSITINWFTKEKTNTIIQFGEDSNTLKEVRKNDEIKPVKIHHFTVDNLKPDTSYYYKIEHFERNTRDHNFKTAPNKMKPFNFIVLGDTQNGGGLGQEGWSYPTIVKQILKHKEEIDIYLHVGDFMDQGNDLRSWHAMWEASRDIVSEIPLFISIGNHDGGTQFMKDPDPNMKKYPDEGANFDYFLNYKYGKPADEDEITSFISRYYSIRYSNAIFLMLDSKEKNKASLNTAQWKFIEKELKDLPDNIWKFVVVHRPQAEVGANKEGKWDYKHNYYAPYMVPLFDKYGVDFVFQGHAHNYQNLDWIYSRNAPFYKQTDSPTGKVIHYIVTGGSGNKLRESQPLDLKKANLKGLNYYENSSQYLLIKVDGNKVVLQSRYGHDDSVMHEMIYTKN